MQLHPEAIDRNARLESVAPQVLEALSPLGRRSFFPKGIPFQAGQAKNCTINATIGQITDGGGEPLTLAPMAEKVPSLPAKDVFLYAPIQGRDQCRAAWHAKLVKEDARMSQVALGQVAAGICHAISMGADLFFSPGDTLVVPDLYWDNYDQIFGIRLEGQMATYPFYSAEGGFNLEGLRARLASVEGKVHVILNFPSNPSGYSPTPAELLALANILEEAARDRIVVVFVDDAYHGLVFDKAATTKSLFYDLLGRSANLIPLKCDGVTKELAFFGGRVSFLHFGVEKAAADLLVDKCKGLIRAGIGGTVAISQVMTEVELADPRHDAEFERIRGVLQQRCDTLKAALAKPTRHWTVLPFNAGCFCLLKLREGLNAEEVRQKLIHEESCGVVSQGSDYIRLAFCSMRESDIVPLVEALDRVCERM